MSQHYAVVVAGKVVNTVVWDGEASYDAPADASLVAIPFTDEYDEDAGVTQRRYAGGIGWDYVDGQFVDNRPVDEEPV